MKSKFKIFIIVATIFFIGISNIFIINSTIPKQDTSNNIVSIADNTFSRKVFVDLDDIGEVDKSSDDISASNLCKKLKGTFRIVGFLVLGLKIAVPIILIVVGMFDMVKAMTSQKDEQIKEAQMGLIKKFVAAIAVFLVFTITTLITSIVGADEWQYCLECIRSPGECQVNR